MTTRTVPKRNQVATTTEQGPSREENFKQRSSINPCGPMHILSVVPLRGASRSPMMKFQSGGKQK